MKKQFILLVCLLCTTFGSLLGQSTQSDSTVVNRKVIGYDKFQHAAVSCLLTLSGQYVLESKSDMNKNNALMYSATSSAIVGMTKELDDMQKRSKPFDWGDMIANFVGIGLAVAIIII